VLAGRQIPRAEHFLQGAAHHHRPVVRAVRFITPRLVLDAHIPVLTFFLLFWLWIMLAFASAIFAACMAWRAEPDPRGFILT